MALPFVAPPDIPEDRARVLKSAFMAMAMNEAFRADMKKVGIMTSPIDGEAVHALIAKAAKAPDAVQGEIRQAAGRKMKPRILGGFGSRRLLVLQDECGHWCWTGHANQGSYRMSDYSLLNIQRSGQIATIELIRIEKHLREQQGRGKRGGAQRAAEVGRALNELRDDNTVRVIVITGKDDVFTIPPSSYGHHGSPGSDWDIMSGVTRAVEAMCTIEKPVIAKVNGHAVGFGANLVLACDFIIAREDAIIADHHMSCGELIIDGKVAGSADHCMVTGDGGAVFAPLKMPHEHRQGIPDAGAALHRQGARRHGRRQLRRSGGRARRQDRRNRSTPPQA